MKKIITTLLMIVVAITLYSQKIPLIKKEAMFKNTLHWQNYYAQRIKTAPLAIANKITKFNTEAVTKGLTFRIGYTSKWNIPLAQLTGAFMPNPSSPSYRPSPAFRNLPLRLNTVRISETVSSASADFRDYGIVTPIRDQMQCGSCWAFGAIAILETSWLLKNGGDASAIDLSEQQVLNCTNNCSCNGGWNNDATKFTCENRISPEASYIYKAKDSICGNGRNITSVYKGRRWDWVNFNISDLKQAIIDHGSVSTSIWVSDEFKNYAGGVYNLDNAPPFGRCNHVVQIVGWDDGLGAWLIKNSWGTGWGEGGFAWMKYGTNYVGSHAVWVEAETTGDLNIVVNNPFQTRPGPLNFATSDYTTLKAAYAKVSMYRIENRQSRKVIDVDDPVIGSGDKGHKVHQWSSHGEQFGGSDGHNQEWFFLEAGKIGEKPVYKIYNYGFNNFLQANTANPRCEAGNANQNQLWYIMPQNSRSTIKIKNVGTGKFLQVPAGDNGDGAVMQMGNESSANNQLFDLNIMDYFPNIEETNYRLLPKHKDNMALDLTAGNLNNGTGLQIWQKMDNNTNQSWKFTYNWDNATYSLHPKMDENKTVEVFGSSMDNGGRVGIRQNTGAANQQWVVIRIARENDKFFLFNVQSGRCLDVFGVGTTNGTTMQQWECVNNDNQKWKFEKLN